MQTNEAVDGGYSDLLAAARSREAPSSKPGGFDAEGALGAGFSDGQVLPGSVRTAELSSPDQEREADALAARALSAPRPSVPVEATSPADGGVQPLHPELRRWFEPRLGHDFSRVRVHTGPRAAAQAQELDARAFTLGNDVAFAAGAYDPGSREGQALLAHELAHVKLGAGKARVLGRKTRGDQAYEKAHADWLDPDASVKADVDVIKVALNEVKAGKNVNFNQAAAKKKIASALSTLGKSNELADAEADWNWLVQNRASAGKPDYTAKQSALFNRLKTPLATLGAQHPRAQTKYWLKNSPPQVLDVIIDVADAYIPAEQLWAYANVEGLVDFVRDEIGLAKTSEPTDAQLKSVSTTTPVSGFGYLGLDDFFTDLTAKREPLSDHLPKGYNTSKVALDVQQNEKGREVQSGIFPNLKMGLQALASSLKRHRTLFQKDASAHGYAAPTTDELVYWTYVYFNAGEYNGQLKKYAKKRRLYDWISKHEYLNAIKLLESYRMVKAMNIF